MSQAKKVTKFQTGGIPKTQSQYKFNVNGQTVSLNEEELNSYYADFLNNAGGGVKNQEDWNRDFTDLKTKISSEQSKGRYFSFDVGSDDQGDRTIGVNAQMPFADNAEKGLKNNGKTAKPGFLSNITGVKNEGARNALLYGHMGKWLAGAKKGQDAQFTQDELKRKADEELAANKLKDENNKFYSSFK
jgi:hypothetical protein